MGREAVSDQRSALSGERGPGDGREAGFTLVMFLVIIALMAIAMGVAVQTVSFQMQREREAELVFRGGQYVEAIRLYKVKYGRYPMSLKEIWEAKPRVIRKKFKDPINDSENWGLIFLAQGQGRGGRRVAGGGGPGGQQPTPSPTPDAALEGEEGGLLGGIPRETGPVIGVHSRSCDTSIKVLDGRTRYCDWKFSFEEDQSRQQGPGRGNAPWGAPKPVPDGGDGGGLIKPPVDVGSDRDDGDRSE